MSDPFIGEIRMFAGIYAPQGWAFCNGAIQSIAENPTLFNLIGTTYGGDGQNTFALPDLQGRVPVHQGPGYTQGQVGGTETVSITPQTLAAHTHPAACAVAASNSANPAGIYWGPTTDNQYGVHEYAREYECGNDRLVRHLWQHDLRPAS